MNIEPYMAVVVWLDSALNGAEMEQQEAVEEIVPVVGTSVGWVLRDDDTAVVLALSRFQHAAHTGWRQISAIPRCAVVSVQRLKARAGPEPHPAAERGATGKPEAT